MTKVIDTHYKYYPTYMLRLTITLPLQPQTSPFFMWKILLLLELPAYTTTCICTPHTSEINHQLQPPNRALLTDCMHLLTCTNHMYQVACAPGSLTTTDHALHQPIHATKRWSPKRYPMSYEH